MGTFKWSEEQIAKWKQADGWNWRPPSRSRWQMIASHGRKLAHWGLGAFVVSLWLGTGYFVYRLVTEAAK